MCFFSSDPPHDNSAEQARADEQARQDRISAGQKNIDTAFGAFDDNYYNKVSGDYTGYYQPQLDEQYQKAIQKETLQLAGSGNLTSSSGATALSDVRRTYDRQKTAMADAALKAANDVRGQVESNKTDLYATNRAAADPTQAESLATARVGTLQAPQAFSPLGDIFAAVLSNGTNQALLSAANKNGSISNFFTAPSLSGSGSGTNVR